LVEVGAATHGRRSLSTRGASVPTRSPILPRRTWYIKHLGATAGESPTQVLFGKMLIAIVKTDTVQPSAGSAIDHIGLSFTNLGAKMRELPAAGVKIVTPVRDVPGLFKFGFIEDPWGVEIEVVQDAERLGFHLHLSAPDPEASLKWYEVMVGGEREKLKGRIDGRRYNGIWLLVAKSTTPPVSSGERAVMSVGWTIRDINAAAAALRRRARRASSSRGRSASCGMGSSRIRTGPVSSCCSDRSRRRNNRVAWNGTVPGRGHPSQPTRRAACSST
jgi:hypothetical protein